MCLYTLYRTPKVAAEDIICYKVLVRKRNGHLYTPYIGARASVGKAIEAKYPNKQIVDRIGGAVYLVKGEGVHAYTAKEVAIRLPFPASWIWTVVEATIPAGTEYWCSFEGMEIAARKMIINRIIYQKEPGTRIPKCLPMTLN